MSKTERLEIELSDRYSFTRDQNNYNLLEKRTTKDGNETKAVIGHFGTMGRLVNKIIEHEIKTAETSDLKALYRKMIEVEREITSKLERVVFEHEKRSLL